MARVSFGQMKGAQPAQEQTAPVAAKQVVATAPVAATAAATTGAAPMFKRAGQKASPPPPPPAVAAAGGFKRARSVMAVAEQADAVAAVETDPIPVEVEVVQESPAQAPAPTPAPAPAPAPAPQTQALVPAQSQAVAKATAFGGLFEDVADIDFRDLQLPRINLVQKSGALADQFDPGDIVFMKEVALPAPVTFLLLGFRKTSFVEKVADGEEGTICHTEEEVKACGGTTEWTQHDETGCSLFQRFTTALVLIKAPEGTPEDITGQYFPYEMGGGNWALAAWSLKGPSYTGVVKPLKTARRFGYLRGGYHTCLHELSSKLKTYKTGRSGYIPIVKMLPGAVGEEFLQELTALMESFAGSEDE